MQPDVADASYQDEEAISAWAKPIVGMAKSLGLMHGRENHRFYPKEAVGRAESAKAIMNLITK